MTAPAADPWFDTAQAATYLGVSEDTVLRACKRGAARGGIDAFRPTRHVLIRQSELDRFIAAHTGGDQLATRRRRRRTTARTA